MFPFYPSGSARKYQLTTALARLRERGDCVAVGEGFADLARRTQPLTPASPYPPLGEGRYQLRPRCESKCKNSKRFASTCACRSG